MPDSEDENLITHLEALRNALLRCVYAVMIASPIGFLSADHVINALVKWSLPAGLSKLSFFSPMEVFIIQLKVGLVVSFSLIFPFIIKEIWGFLLPALHKHERKFLRTIVISSTFLFILGVAFCTYFILPLVMRFSASFATSTLQPVIGLGSFINLAGCLVLAFGIMFQFPLLVLALVHFGLVSVETLEDKRSYIIVLILILAAIFSPPDVVSQLLLGVPTYLLFEIGLFIAKRIKIKSEIEVQNE